LQRKEVFSPAFDNARRLLDMVCRRLIDQANLDEIEEMTPVIGAVLIDSQRTNGITNLGPADLRQHYDPDRDPGDKLLENFPKNCVSEEGNHLIVRLPYGKCLRGVVRFPLDNSSADGDAVRS
jgi:hypothetical protein